MEIILYTANGTIIDVTDAVCYLWIAATLAILMAYSSCKALSRKHGGITFLSLGRVFLSYGVRKVSR